MGIYYLVDDFSREILPGEHTFFYEFSTQPKVLGDLLNKQRSVIDMLTNLKLLQNPQVQIRKQEFLVKPTRHNVIYRKPEEIMRSAASTNTYSYVVNSNGAIQQNNSGVSSPAKSFTPYQPANYVY